MRSPENEVHAALTDIREESRLSLMIIMARMMIMI